MTNRLTGEQKAAILLLTIGEDAAAAVMKHLSPTEIRKLGAHLAALSSISKEQEIEVIQEFKSAASGGEIGVEGRKYVKTVLDKALGSGKATQLMRSLTTETYPGIDTLKWMDAKAVANLLRVEHPQTIAVVLAHLDPEHASQVIALLPEGLRSDTLHRLATMDEVQPDTLQHLSEVLEEVLQDRSRPQSMSIGGTKVTADILNRLDKSNGGTIIAKLAERDAALADTIRSLMFVFDDLVKIDDRGIQELLKDVGKEELTLALRAANNPVKDKIFKNMSSRAAEGLREDMETKGPAKLTDIERAQQKILQTVRRLEEEGKIVVGGAGAEAMV